MKVSIHCFGGLRHRFEEERFSLQVPEESTIADLLRILETQAPGLKSALQVVATAINDEIVGPTEILHEGDEVALLPPVSGGLDAPKDSEDPWLSREPLNLDALLKETYDESCGGLVIFSGDIRRQNQGRADVVAMEYEAHGPIAAKVLAQIEEEIRHRFQVARIRIQHRLGRVALGESSVLVVCRAAHRDAAFQGARYGIDELKVRTPIWKREHYSDGTSKYLDGTPLQVGPTE